MQGDLSAGPVRDGLLDALACERSGEQRGLAAAIAGAQREVVTSAPAEVLIVQGGAGTGRTLVGMQRVAWLLESLAGRLDPRDVLIVGPHPTFVRYLSTVLRPLDDHPVEQIAISELGPRVRVGRVDPPEVRRLKGDRRLMRLIVCALRNRQRIKPEPIELRVGARVVYVDGKRVAERARQLAGRPHNAAHRELASQLVEVIHHSVGGRNGGRVPPGRPTPREVARAVDGYLEHAWPSLTPQAFLIDLFSSARELASAAAGLLSDHEIDLLTLPGDARAGAWQWSVDDMPLLDAAHALLNGVPRTFEHILVDEAQDLSPMQLESIRRRSRTGSMTLLGDLAQATGPWAHTSWDEVALHVRRDRVPTRLAELEHCYRLPAEIQAVAGRLLPHIAPDVAPPRAVRRVGRALVDDVAVSDAAGLADIAEDVVTQVRKLLGSGMVGVIVPGRLRARVAAALERAGVAWTPELRGLDAPVVLLSPEAAKGLELDQVVVVEPSQIVDESASGLRSLYVAMTRGTSQLVLVHSQPLPTELGSVHSAQTEVDGAETNTHPADRYWAEARVPSPPTGTGDRPAEVGVMPAEVDDTQAEVGVMPAEVDDMQAEVGVMPAEVDDMQAEVDEVPAKLGDVDESAQGSEVEQQAVDATDDMAPGDDRMDHPTSEPPSVDWRLSIPREFVARAAPAQMPTPQLSVLPEEPETPMERPAEPPAPLAVFDSRSNGANGVVTAEDPVDDGPFTELDREIARAVATALAAKLSRYITPSILPLVADELGRLSDHAHSPRHGTGAPSDPSEPADMADTDGPMRQPRHLR